MQKDRGVDFDCNMHFNSHFFETGAMSTPIKSPNPTIFSGGGLTSTQ